MHRSLSPSRAADFMTCPLLYRFRVIDRLPEPPSPAAARGTLVHAVLERLFDEPPAGRTPVSRAEPAGPAVGPAVGRGARARPACSPTEAERAVWLDEAAAMLDRYFTLEDPTRLEPAHREMSVQTVLDVRPDPARLHRPAGRGADRRGPRRRLQDRHRAAGGVRGPRAVPDEVLRRWCVWRTAGTIPRQLQLIYLGNGEIMRCVPDEADLLATERKINALWQAIERARASGDWRPRQSRLCDWCAHQALCPVFGGTPPPLPVLIPAPGPEPRRRDHPGREPGRGSAQRGGHARLA